MDQPSGPPTLPSLPPPPPDIHWSPPPAPVDTGMPEPVAPTHEWSTPSQPSSRGRSGLFVLAGVLALVLVGIGALFALRGGGGGDDGGLVAVEDASSFSLQAAAETASSASTVRYEMSMAAGSFGSMTMTGGLDTDAQVMTFEMDMGALLGGGEGGRIDAIIDMGGGVMYMTNPGFFPSDTPWVSMDMALIAEQTGMTIEDYQDQLAANPLDVARLFTQADQIVDVGPDTIDGVAVQHYRVTVDIADALDANPQLQQQVDLEMLGDEFPNEIEYDVWVTEDNQLRRMTFAMDVLGQDFTVAMDVTEVGEPLVVNYPAPSDVTDISDLLGF